MQGTRLISKRRIKKKLNTKLETKLLLFDVVFLEMNEYK
jgi:hypothetical protein